MLMNHKELIHRHHLLEIIIWPNGDGTFRTIFNSRDRLKELGIYDDFKMTIHLTKSEHTRLHNKTRTGNRNPMYGMTGNRNPMYGKTFSAESKRKLSEAAKRQWASYEARHKRTGNRNPMYGKTFSDESKRKISEAVKAAWARRKHCV